MAEMVVSFLVERLGDLLIQEAKFLYGVSDQVKSLQDELERMRCFLRDADSREQEGDARVCKWISDIRNLAYDAEDVIDTIALNVPSKRNATIAADIKNFIKLSKKATLLQNVGSRIEEIKDRISELTRSLRTYGIMELKEGEGCSRSSNDVKRQLRRTYSHVVDNNVVGLNENVKTLVAQLVKKENHSRVVSICGMGGLGKTTMARKVYYDEEVRRHFNCFGWECISQQWETRKIWEDILVKLILPNTEQRKEIGKMTDDEVARKLYKVLQERRCLVVLDDIWGTNVWECLSAGFPTHDTNSKIILTSRNKDVALHADPRGFVHEPSCLNDEESWELFHKIAIFERQGTDKISELDMEKLGLEMIRHCRGLPLAIVVLGGILAKKQTVDEWDRVHENIKSHLKRGKGREDQQLGVFEVLGLSYDDLSYELKACFLHLGQFPEDFEIFRKRLINLWVAEGIISTESCEDESKETLEDVAYRHLTELTERYMVQVESRTSSGKIKSCRIHDLMGEVCLSKAKENNFLQIIHLYDNNRPMELFSSSMVNKPSSTSRIRRVSLHLNNFHGSISLDSKKCPPIRSALGFCMGYREIDKQLMKPMVRNFKLLRVFDLEDLKGLAVPENIGNLTHLRLLNLRHTFFQKLPSSIGNLRCLLTLNLDHGYETTLEIPNVIWKMEQLRHLYLPPDYGHKTKRLQLANLKNLRTLINFCARKTDVEDLITLTNLRKLVMVGLEGRSLRRLVEIFNPSTITFNHLRSLSINSLWGDFTRRDADKILSCCSHLRKLKKNGELIFPRASNFV